MVYYTIRYCYAGGNNKEKRKSMQNTKTENMYAQLGISDKVYNFCKEILDSLSQRFEEIDKNAEYNQLKVIKAMQDCKVSEACLLGTTGYGYNDLGRETLEAVYASLFHAEDALVRPQITCGTHALALALMKREGMEFYHNYIEIPDFLLDL